VKWGSVMNIIRTKFKIVSVTWLIVGFLHVSAIGYAVAADEVVLNKAGDSILLKSDGTWSVINDQSEDGRIVFMISQGENYYSRRKWVDQFEKFLRYDNYIGCRYHVTIKNNLNIQIHVNGFNLQTDNIQLFSRNSYSFHQFNQVINPGSSFEGTGAYQSGTITKTHKSTGDLSKNTKANLFEKYGCDAQKGSIYVNYVKLNPFISVPEGGKITNSTVDSFVIGSSKGKYPLQEQLRKR
jgi:hypothetical protein